MSCQKGRAPEALVLAAAAGVVVAAAAAVPVGAAAGRVPTTSILALPQWSKRSSDHTRRGCPQKGGKLVLPALIL